MQGPSREKSTIDGGKNLLIRTIPGLPPNSEGVGRRRCWLGNGVLKRELVAKTMH